MVFPMSDDDGRLGLTLSPRFCLTFYWHVKGFLRLKLLI